MPGPNRLPSVQIRSRKRHHRESFRHASTWQRPSPQSPARMVACNSRNPITNRLPAHSLLCNWSVPRLATSHRRNRPGGLPPGVNSTMHIRIMRQCPAPIDGFSVAQLMVGHVYDIKDSTAAFLIATGCAEPSREPQSATRSSDYDSPNSTPYRTTGPVATAAECIHAMTSKALRILVPASERVLWRLRKGERIAEARVCEMAHGRELKLLVDGILWWNQLLCVESGDLMPRAIATRNEFERLGWKAAD